MAHERWTNRALKTLMVAVLAISAVWIGPADGRASEATEPCGQYSEANCSPCPTAFSIVDARQTDHLWKASAGSGSPPNGRAVIEVEVAWPGSISHPLNGTPGWDDRSISLDTAGVHEIGVGKPPPGANDIYDSQQPKVHDYELTFQPFADEQCVKEDGTVGWPSTSTQTASITWTPLPFGCLHTSPFEFPCYSRTVTLDIAKNVFSGKIAEPAGGTRCSKDLNQEIVVEIRKAGRPVAKVSARGGVFSKKFDLSKAKFTALRKGTFATHIWVSDAGSYLCGYANSAPVTKG